MSVSMCACARGWVRAGSPFNVYTQVLGRVSVAQKLCRQICGSQAHTWCQRGCRSVGAGPGRPKGVPEGWHGQANPPGNVEPGSECLGQSLTQGSRVVAWWGFEEPKGWHL